MGRDSENRLETAGEPRAMMADDSQRRLRLVLLVSTLAILPLLVRIYWPAGNGLDVTNHPIGRDFINVWVGPQLAFSGRMSSLFEQAAYWREIQTAFGRALPFHNWSYPPIALPLFWPFAQLPYFVALAAWLGLTFAMLLGVTLSVLPRRTWLTAAPLLALSHACLINGVGGQNGFLTGALFLFGTLFLSRAPILAGIAFGILTFKPHLGILLPFTLVMLGAWRTIAAATLTTIGLAMLSVATLGLEPWRLYVTETLPLQALAMRDFDGFFTLMMVSVTAAMERLGASLDHGLLAQAVIGVPVAITAVWAAGRTTDPVKRSVVLAVATPLVTPYAFNYDLCAVAALLTICVVSGRPYPNRVLVVACWLCPTLTMNVGLTGLGGLVAPVTLLSLFVCVVRDIRSDDRRHSPLSGAHPTVAGRVGRRSVSGPRPDPAPPALAA